MLSQVAAEYPRLFVLGLVVVVGWVAAVVLYGAQRRAPDVLSLKDATGRAVVTALVLTISFVGFSNMRFGYPWWDEEVNFWIIFFVIVGLATPNFVFLWAYFTGQFSRHR